MSKLVKECFGTKLVIEIFESENYDFSNIIWKVEQFENKYSRFIEWNYLSKLNTEKKASLDSELFSILKVANHIHLLSNGFFDITLLPKLEKIGYGKSQNISRNIGQENILIKDWEIILQNDITIELWSLGKGYMLDVIYNILSKTEKNFIVNFGWDIRVQWKHRLYLEDPYSESKYIGEILIENKALTSSSAQKRRTKKGTHLINPKDWKLEVQAIYLTHRLWVFADGFATALFVMPLKECLRLLGTVNWLEWCVIDNKGQIHISKNWNANLYI